MGGNFESLRQRDSNTEDSGSLGAILHNEAYIFGSGLAGSLKEIKQAAGEAGENLASTTLKVGAGVAVAGVLGFCSRRAGLAGIVGRGAMAALGVNFAFDAASPILGALGDGLSARSRRDLDLAGDRLSSGLGRFTLDTLITLPFAVGASAIGRSAGRAVFGSAKASEAAGTSSASRVAGEAQTARASSNRGHSQFRTTSAEHSGPARHSTGGVGEAGRTTRRTVLEGELIVEPGVKSSRASHAREPEIIDAEFTVVEETVLSRRLSLPHNSAALPEKRLLTSGSNHLPAKTTAPDTSTNLPVRQGESSVADLRTGYFGQHPSDRSPTPEQIKKALRAYTETTPQTASIIDVRI